MPEENFRQSHAPRVTAAPILAHLQGTGQFAGKTALVIGASRGLGAALALELAAEGCTVVATYAQSNEDMQQLLELTDKLPGSLVPERGDASDLQWCVDLKRRICERFGGLDMLVCNAAPAVRPMRLEEATYDRMQSFLQRGFALVGAPLSSFLSVVSAAQGKVLLISSAFVEEPPRNWPHYVALKAGAEGLIRTAAAAHPKVTFWIARPADFGPTCPIHRWVGSRQKTRRQLLIKSCKK